VMSNTQSNLYNLNIERAILSSILFEYELFEEVSFKLKATDFYFPFHVKVFEAMQELVSSDKPIDEIFLKSILIKSKSYDEVAMLDILAANSISNIDAYVEDLIEMSKKRNLAALGINIRKEILEDATDSEDVISLVAKSIEEIDASSSESEESIEKMADEFMEFMDEAKNNNGVVGMRTGLNELDKLEVIAKPGDLVIIGARPSVGKTALALTMVANMIEDKKRVLFTSLDMTHNLIILRLVSILSGETIWSLKRGVPNDAKAVAHALDKIKKYVIIHSEKNISWLKIKNKSKRVFRKNKDVEAWFLDHIGKVAYKEPMFRRFEIGEVTAGAKALGEEMGVVPYLLTQLNRESVSRVGNRPNLGDLKESSSIEEDATHVILPHREAYHNKGKNEREPDITDAELIVAKNQTGPTGIARCKFNSKYTKFTDEGFEIIYDERWSDDEIYHTDSSTKFEMPVIG